LTKKVITFQVKPGFNYKKVFLKLSAFFCLRI